jgi:hypothetical protein
LKRAKARAPFAGSQIEFVLMGEIRVKVFLVAERRRKLAGYEVAGDDAKNNLSRRDNGKPAGNSAVLSGRDFNLRPTRHFVSG